MAYRKQWYTFGVKTRTDIDNIAAANLNNGDSVYNTSIGKTEYLIDASLKSWFNTVKIWGNEDCVLTGDFFSTCQYGEIVQLMLNVGSSPGNHIPFITKCGTGVANNTGQYLGVVYRAPVGFSYNTNVKMVAIQGIYDVKFTAATINVTAGNLAVISSTAGEAAQTGSTASTGVIGVIMETKTLGVDKLAKVMIQSFSSK